MEGAGPPQAPAATDNAAGDERAEQSTWQAFGGLAMEILPALVGAVGFVGFIALIGGAVQWARFWAAELPADQAVRAIPETELVTVGAVSTIVFTLLGLAAALLVYLLDRHPDGTTGTRGLLFVVGVELAAAVTLIELQWWEVLLFVAWALAVAYLAYQPIVRVATVLAPRFRGPDPDGEGQARRRAEQEKYAAAQEELREADDALEIARKRDRPAAEVAAAEAAHRRAEDTLELARRRLARVRERAPDDVPARKPLSLRIESRDLPALGLLLVGLAVIAAYDTTRWLLYVLIVPVLFYIGLLGIARATSRFAWYGVAIFLSVPLFGGVLAMADVLHTPKVQPIALVRKSDDHALCGVYVTQTDDRMYVGRVELRPDSKRRAQPNTGRIFSIPLEDVDIASIGPLQRIDEAQRHAIALLDEVYADRAEEAATQVKNAVTTTERQEQVTSSAPKGGGQAPTTTSKRTTTKETPADPGRPTRREPPPDHPPAGCSAADLD